MTRMQPIQPNDSTPDQKKVIIMSKHNTEHQHRAVPESNQAAEHRRIYEAPRLKRHEDLEQVTYGDDNYQFGTMSMS